jgi:hypothetical protein
MTHKNSSANRILFALLLVVFILVSCQSNASTVAITETAPPVATDAPIVPTIVPSPTVVVTPPELPVTFQSTILNPLDTPHSYIKDSCQYLKNKWDSANAKPGTVVMIIMIKGIYKGWTEEAGGINFNDLKKIMLELKRQNFEAINTKQLLAFLEQNTYIPPRSVMIIQDGNRQYENFDEHLRKYWEDWKWPVVNGWISQPGISETLWVDNAGLESTGFVDHQPSGVMFGTLLSDNSSAAVIDKELQGSVDAFDKRFGKKPIAFIWQGGGFGQKTVEAARKLNYQLGFTSNSRGPVMYNWIPLADELDPARPVYIPEGKIEDPLMTLPRYWPSEAFVQIDNVRAISKQAIAYAEANKKTEMEYYNIVCAPTYGQITTP